MTIVRPSRRFSVLDAVPIFSFRRLCVRCAAPVRLLVTKAFPWRKRNRYAPRVRREISLGDRTTYWNRYVIAAELPRQVARIVRISNHIVHTILLLATRRFEKSTRGS